VGWLLGEAAAVWMFIADASRAYRQLLISVWLSLYPVIVG